MPKVICKEDTPLIHWYHCLTSLCAHKLCYIDICRGVHHIDHILQAADKCTPIPLLEQTEAGENLVWPTSMKEMVIVW